MQRPKRNPLSERFRFAVMQRDHFRCRYCGRSSETTILEIDHLRSVADQGTNDAQNLVTACQSCNRSKGARSVSDPRWNEYLDEFYSHFVTYIAVGEGNNKRAGINLLLWADRLDPDLGRFSLWNNLLYHYIFCRIYLDPKFVIPETMKYMGDPQLWCWTEAVRRGAADVRDGCLSRSLVDLRAAFTRVPGMAS